jgi:hypothetical protein
MSFNRNSDKEDRPTANASPRTSKPQAQVKQFSSVMLAPVLIRPPHTSTQAYPISTSKTSPKLCPKCKKTCGRWHDLKRHIMLHHLPCWIYCPRSGCSWRGDRKDKFRMHLKEQKCLSKPQDKQYQIYEAIMITEWILKDQVPVGVGACYAAFPVGEEAVKLQKVGD